MRLVILLHFFTFLLFASSSLDFTQDEKNFIQSHSAVKIGSIDSYTPFSFIKNGEKTGFTQDLIELISQKSGLKFEKTGGTWPEVYGKFKAGTIDIITEFSYRPERLEFTEYTLPYYEVPIGVFTRNNFGSYVGLESLNGKKVGIVKSSYLTNIVKKIPHIKLVELDSTDKRFYALINGEVDVVLSNALSLMRTESLMLKEIKLSGYFEHEDVKKEDLRFGIRKEQQVLASIMKKTLASIDYAKLTELKQKWIYDAYRADTITPLLNKEEQAWIKNNTILVGIESAKPYIYYNQEVNDIDGLYADIFKQVVKKTGLQVEYIKDKWSNLLENFKNKKLDLLPATFYSKEREKFGLYSNSYYKVKEYMYAKATTKEKFEDLNGKIVAVVKGYATIKKLQKHFPKIRIVETKDLSESVSMVQNQEVDALVDYHLVVDNFLLENAIIDLKGLPQRYLDATSVHYLSHIDKPILHSILQKGLKAISNDEKNQLLKRWFSDVYIANVMRSFTTQEEEFIKTHPVIRFRVRSDRAPFEFNREGKAVGLAVDYIQKSAQNVGLKAEFILDDSSIPKAYKEVETDRKNFDTLLFSVRNPQREERFSFGADYLSYPMMIITYKNAPYIGTMKDLIGKTIVLENGFLTNKWIKNDYPGIKIINVNSTKQALQMVNDEEVIAYVGNLGVANYMSVFGGMENLKVAAPSDYGNVKYSFVAPKEWPELASLLSKGYKQISQVEHTALQQKWFALQTIEKTDYKLLFAIIVAASFLLMWILWWNRKLAIERNKTKLALNNLRTLKDQLELKNEEVYASQQFLQSIIDENPNPIIIKNQEGKFILVNQALANLYNTDKENMIGKDDGDFIEDQKMAEFFKHNIKQIIDSGEPRVVYENSQNVKTGEIRNFMSIKKPFININGEKSILIIANDITDIRNLEKEKLKNQEILFSQSKVAAMGEMIGNIAHQWRQPLSVISTAATGLLMEKKMGVLNDEKFQSSLESINEYAQYLSTTIDTFRDYVKTEKEYKEVILQERIKLACSIVEASFKNNYITIKSNLDVIEPVKIKLVVGELSEVLINLLNNSKDALKENKIENPWVDIQITPYEDKVIITVEDNGGGIKEDIIPRIFDPYFTTKHQSQGTGLGLHMSYKIITESLNGKIYVENTDNGAKFTIILPRD